jgi:hypothetical protein
VVCHDGLTEKYFDFRLGTVCDYSSLLWMSGGNERTRVMIDLSFCRFSAPLVFAFVSLTAGTAGGFTAVHGLALNSYGQAGAAPAAYRAEKAMPQEEGQQVSYDDCQGCSDRDRGYHWASLQRIESVAECPMESWDFRRGCTAYMRDTGGV